MVRAVSSCLVTYRIVLQPDQYCIPWQLSVTFSDDYYWRVRVSGAPVILGATTDSAAKYGIKENKRR